jgi:hypothetical protein
MTACHERLEKVADQICVSVLSDGPSAMLALAAEPDDGHAFARLVGAPYFHYRLEVQQAASGAL